jgi:hypothetical protein
VEHDHLVEYYLVHDDSFELAAEEGREAVHTVDDSLVMRKGQEDVQ